MAAKNKVTSQEDGLDVPGVDGSDKTIPGGAYWVNGALVNGNGEHINKSGKRIGQAADPQERALQQKDAEIERLRRLLDDMSSAQAQPAQTPEDTTTGWAAGEQPSMADPSGLGEAAGGGTAGGEGGGEGEEADEPDDMSDNAAGADATPAAPGGRGRRSQG